MFDHLDSRVVAAPMAGGPSTPALVAAARSAGGLGFLAAGYLSPDRLAADVAEVRRLGVEEFGVNVFVPETRPIDRAAVARYAQSLTAYAGSLCTALPDPTGLGEDNDHFPAKIALLESAQVPFVSFTFGCPPAEAVRRLQTAGSRVGVTVTTVVDARRALEAGADWLCVQGPEAGGHRSTFDRDVEPPTQPLEELLAEVRGITEVPLLAAGGIAGPADATRLRDLGAAAVQLGTLLLRTREAGTREAHADALGDGLHTETIVTRCFSGRAARALRNTFTDCFDASAVPEYPAVNALTSGIRKASAYDAEGLNLWAGTGFAEARVESAAETIARLG